MGAVSGKALLWTCAGLLLVPCAVAVATEREDRTQVFWGAPLPNPPADGEPRPPGENGQRPRPLLVAVRCDLETADQARFDAQVEANDNFKMATKFFDCAQITEARAKEHPLLKDLRLRAPAIVVFDSTLLRCEVAGGRASVMKAYGEMRKICSLDYETDLRRTLTEAKKLLGRFDQVDSARDSLEIKKRRMNDKLADGDEAAARFLQRDIEKDQAEIDAMYREACDEWNELWKLELKPPEGKDD